MSHSNVERIIGLLVTDEAMRERFANDPCGTIRQLAESGLDLTGCERHALAAIDPRRLARFAEAVDPRIQKADLTRVDCSPPEAPPDPFNK